MELPYEVLTRILFFREDLHKNEIQDIFFQKIISINKNSIKEHACNPGVKKTISISFKENNKFSFNLEDLLIFSNLENLRLANFQRSECFNFIGYFKNLVCLSLRNEYGIDLELRIDLHVISEIKSLENLYLEYASLHGNLECLSKNQKLTELHIYASVDYGDISGNINFLTGNQMIKLVSLSNLHNVVFDINVFGTCPNLEFLTLANTDYSDDTNIFGDITSLSNNHKLKRWCFIGCSQIKGDLEFFKKCPFLKSQEFKDCSQIKGNISYLEDKLDLEICIFVKNSHICGNINVLQNLRNLVTLNLWYQSEIEGDMRYLAKLLNLQEIIISSCEKIFGTTESLKNLRYLKKLHLNRLPLFSGDVSFLKKLKHLEDLKIMDTPEVHGEISSFKFIHSLRRLTLINNKISGSVKELHTKNKRIGYLNIQKSFIKKN